jgi:hypothetical protein
MKIMARNRKFIKHAWEIWGNSVEFGRNSKELSGNSGKIHKNFPL